jgi:hypothetical protein
MRMPGREFRVRASVADRRNLIAGIQESGLDNRIGLFIGAVCLSRFIRESQEMVELKSLRRDSQPLISLLKLT